jgi:hypothetical protein
MSALTAARAELAAQLAEAVGSAVKVYPYVPEMLTGPALVIQPGNPYLTTDEEVFGIWRLNFIVTAVAEVATNQTTTEQLDGIISDLLELDCVEEVGEPYAYVSNTAVHLAADIKASIEHDPKEED